MVLKACLDISCISTEKLSLFQESAIAAPYTSKQPTPALLSKKPANAFNKPAIATFGFITQNQAELDKSCQPEQQSNVTKPAVSTELTPVEISASNEPQPEVTSSQDPDRKEPQLILVQNPEFNASDQFQNNNKEQHKPSQSNSDLIIDPNPDQIEQDKEAPTTTDHNKPESQIADAEPPRNDDSTPTEQRENQEPEPEVNLQHANNRPEIEENTQESEPATASVPVEKLNEEDLGPQREQENTEQQKAINNVPKPKVEESEQSEHSIIPAPQVEKLEEPVTSPNEQLSERSDRINGAADQAETELNKGSDENQGDENVLDMNFER